MSTPHKFLFDQSFDKPAAARPPRSAAPPPPPPEPTFSRAELETARAEGFVAGRETALTEASQSMEERIASALSNMAAGIHLLIDAQKRHADEAHRHTIEIVRAIFQKAMPTLSRKAPLAELESLVSECLREAFDEPRIVLRVADTMFEAIQQRLGALTASTGFSGRVVLLADEMLGPGDTRVEWAEGGAERDMRRVTRDIDDILVRAIDSLTVTAAPSSQENPHE